MAMISPQPAVAMAEAARKGKRRASGSDEMAGSEKKRKKGPGRPSLTAKKVIVPTLSPKKEGAAQDNPDEEPFKVITSPPGSGDKPIYECNHDQCSYRTKQQKRYNDHLASHDKEGVDEKPKGFVCSKCQKIFVDFEVYKTHVQAHFSLKLYCSSCGYTALSTDDLNNHLIIKHGKSPIFSYVICSNCRRFRATSQALIDYHMQDCIKSVVVKEVSILDPVSSSRQADLSMKQVEESSGPTPLFRIVQHKSGPLKIVLSPSKEQDMEEKEKKKDIVIACGKCSFTTDDPANFGIHMFTEHSHKCPHCHFTSESRERTRIHVKLEHSDEEQIPEEHVVIDLSDEIERNKTEESKGAEDSTTVPVTVTANESESLVLAPSQSDPTPREISYESDDMFADADSDHEDLDPDKVPTETGKQYEAVKCTNQKSDSDSDQTKATSSKSTEEDPKPSSPEPEVGEKILSYKLKPCSVSLSKLDDLNLDLEIEKEIDVVPEQITATLDLEGLQPSSEPVKVSHNDNQEHQPQVKTVSIAPETSSDQKSEQKVTKSKIDEESQANVSKRSRRSGRVREVVTASETIEEKLPLPLPKIEVVQGKKTIPDETVEDVSPKRSRNKSCSRITNGMRKPESTATSITSVAKKLDFEVEVEDHEQKPTKVEIKKLKKSRPRASSDAARPSFVTTPSKLRKVGGKQRLSLNEMEGNYFPSWLKQDRYLPNGILNRLDGRLCLDCKYLGPKRFDTIRHIRNLHLKTKLFFCNHCSFADEKMTNLRQHFFAEHVKDDSEDPGENEDEADDTVIAPLLKDRADELRQNGEVYSLFMDPVLSGSVEPTDFAKTFAEEFKFLVPIIRKFRECKECRFKTTDENQWTEHQDLLHGEQPLVNGQENHYVDKAGRSVSPKESSRKRFFSPDKVIVPSTTNKNSSSSSEAKNSVATIKQERVEKKKETSGYLSEETFSCITCKLSFASIQDLVHHQDEKHRKPEKCPKCPELQFNTKHELQQHFESTHVVMACALCDFKTHSDTELVAHVHTHEDQHHSTKDVVSNFNCPLCQYDGSDAEHLLRHLKVQHKERIEEECPFCQYKKSSSTIVRHISVVHMDIRKHRCRGCNHRFTCQRDLNNHRKSHLNNCNQ